ncbi:hypothetical protein F3Y22_tig00112249pilonHSYRG00381 [Hibiscus syriacus]|uniref:RNase H type-1 domain-containing protein n=1 Tax=Hibiscus syriacus TaxID=106335 RepID=A0A6A2YCJ0_HIBSY|nr:hypothetical protein F3Y22_tig00112249pilonHSYRG00381 [Hibiscus syriacus]
MVSVDVYYWIMLWRLWKQRRSFVFEGEIWTTQAIIRFVKSRVQSIKARHSSTLPGANHRNNNQAAYFSIWMEFVSPDIVPALSLFYSPRRGFKRITVEMDNKEVVWILSSPVSSFAIGRSPLNISSVKRTTLLTIAHLNHMSPLDRSDFDYPFANIHRLLHLDMD